MKTIIKNSVLAFLLTMVAAFSFAGTTDPVKPKESKRTASFSFSDCYTYIGYGPDGTTFPQTTCVCYHVSYNVSPGGHITYGYTTSQGDCGSGNYYHASDVTKTSDGKVQDMIAQNEGCPNRSCVTFTGSINP